MKKIIIGSIIGLYLTIWLVSATDISQNESRDAYEACLKNVQAGKYDYNCESLKPQTLTGTVITGSVPTGPDMTLENILKIKNPYEQCLAYVAYKKLSNANCKERMDTPPKWNEPSTSTGSRETLLPKSNIENCTPGTRCEEKKTNTWSVIPPQIKPPVTCSTVAGWACEKSPPKTNTGTNSDENEMKEIIVKISQLKTEERRELIKIIRAYLNSKHPITTEIIKNKKNDDTTSKNPEVKNTQEAKKTQEIKIKQEELRQKQIELQKKYIEQIQSIRTKNKQ